MFMHRLSSIRIVPALVLLVGLGTPARADVISDWNARAETIATEKKLLPPPNAHGLARLPVRLPRVRG
jgi:hypothetical protein